MDFAFFKALTAEDLLKLPRIENVRLTGAEMTVAATVLKGMNTIAAAESIFRTDKCVKYHLTTIYKKCKVKSRAELIAKYLPGMVVDKFVAKIEEKQKRIECLELLISELQRELGRQALPRGLTT
jgi:DNA-binding CsgD family transcriptional regulator